MGHQALPVFRLEPGVCIAQAMPQYTPPVTLSAPALDVMTDLTQVIAATVHPSTTLRQAEQIMVLRGVRMLFVATDRPAFVGLVTTTDLHGDRQMRITHERNLRFDDLCVADVMTGLSTLDALDFEQARGATVGQVIATLQRCGRNHLLVVEDATPHTPRRVRGVISRAQIERQSGLTITVTPIASSFSEIERALA